MDLGGPFDPKERLVTFRQDVCAFFGKILSNALT